MVNELATLKCKVCGIVFTEYGLLHRHLRLHKLKKIEYYNKFYPHKDKYTGEFIDFRSLQFYFHSDFNSRENLQAWIKSNDKETVAAFIKDLLVRRKEAKRMRYSPSQVELRSIIMPSIITYERYCGDYYKLCEELGFINKFKYIEKIPTERPLKSPIIIDTREQLPLEFDVENERGTLPVGDYALLKFTQSPALYIERKSTSDLISTLSNGFERFEREVVKAKESNIYLVVLVEDTLTRVINFPRQCDVSPQLIITPEFIFKNVRTLCQKFPNIQFLFADGRAECSRLVKKLFATGSLYREADLQVLQDKRLL